MYDSANIFGKKIVTGKRENMSDDEDNNNPDQYSGEFQHTPVTARVPEHVANGVFANGVVVGAET